MTFYPRLPLEPFPWSIPQNLPVSHDPQTILILGEPPIHDILPLLTSTHLSSSLVLVATDTPPLIPPNTQGPALRILRLSQPLAVHDAGALRLVCLFERAQRVAHLWPSNSSPHYLQLAQPSPNGDFSIIEPISYVQPSKNSPTVQLDRFPSSASSTEEYISPPHKKFHRPKSSHDKVEYQPFDAIINFLPHGLPDKSLLKHAILVTTLSAQFLALSKSHAKPQARASHSFSSPSKSTISTSSRSISDKRSDSFMPTSTSRIKNRFSLIFRPMPPPLSPPPSPRSQSTKLSDIENSITSPNVKNAHLVHVLPVGWSPDYGSEIDRRAPTSSPLRSPGPSCQRRSIVHFKTPGGIGATGKPKLVQSIEQFLLSFAYPLGNPVSGGFGSGSAYSGTGLYSSSPNSSTSNIDEEPITKRLPRPTSNLYLKGNERENSPLRASTLPTKRSMSNITVSSNTDAPLKPAPYLLAPGLFGKCVPGSGGSNVRSRFSSTSTGYGVNGDDLHQNHEEDASGGAYMDPYTDMEATALTIGEIILLGALDFNDTRHGNGRAWIANVGDVVVVGGSPDHTGWQAGVGKGKGREMMKPTKKDDNVGGLPTPPQSSSSNNSTESIEEEQEETKSVDHDTPPTLSADSSSPTSTAPKPGATGARNITSSSLSSLTLPTSNSTTLAKSTFTSQPTSQRSMNTPKARSKLSKQRPLSSAFSVPKVPPLAIHRDSRSGDEYDLGIELETLPRMPVSRNGGPGSGSMILPPQRPINVLEDSTRRGTKRKGFVNVLKKMGLWKSGGESVGVGLKV